jgi:hypothetical protein
MRLRITLSKDMIEKVEVEALARHQASRDAGVVNQQVGKQSSAVTDIVGLMGEVGFSGIFGMERDDTVGPRSGTADFTSENGELIEVKSSHHPNPHLLVPAYQINGEWTTKEPISIYVLMQVDYPARAVTFMGWADRKDVVNKDRLERFRGADRLSFVVPPEDLIQLDEITCGVLVWDAKTRGQTVELT